MILRFARIVVERSTLVRDVRHISLLASTSTATPLEFRRWRQRVRTKLIDPIAFNKTVSSKRVVGYYKDMTASELATALEVPFDDVVDVLVNLDKRNLDAAASDNPINQDYSAKAIAAFQCKPKLLERPHKAKEQNEDLEPQEAAPANECTPRTPVVTIMGHVDHGKTTLLDSLRNSRIVDGEFGGITQHIGAFSVYLPSMKRSVTFLDTPGHAAFGNMRSRGAKVTDVVVLVVAADDGVKEQTEQSIKFAREAGVPIVVAINKCDKPTADPARAKRSLLQHDVVVEEMGGDVQCVEVSALHGKGLVALQEAILTQADLLELRAPVKGLVEGHVLESSLMPGLGKVCTVLVSRGTLTKGRVLVAGTAYTRVRSMTDETGKEVSEAKPGAPVRVSGWKDSLPSPGDLILEAPSTGSAERAIKWRQKREMDEKAEKDWKETEGMRQADRERYLENRKALLDKGRRYGSSLRLIAHKKEQFRKDVGDGHPRLRIILRTDVEGSLEAILDVLATYTSEKVDLQIVDFDVGAPTARDVENAANTGALLYTFNVDTPAAVRKAASDARVELKPFNVVYRLVDALKEDLSNSLPEEKERILVGQGHVLKEFMISDRNRKRQPIAGVLVDWGEFQRNCMFRFSRNSQSYFEGSVESMKCNTEMVASAKTNTEVGLALDDKTIRFKEDDSIEVYEEKPKKQAIDWYPPGF